ncbi:MAG: hypothetical protein SFW67_37275 [Myxococcaceae bacterium]|nr:hypothetical protein [Myxococcaceae bacterium]
MSALWKVVWRCLPMGNEERTPNSAGRARLLVGDTPFIVACHQR